MKRCEVSNEFKWSIEEIFKSNDEFYKSLNQLLNNISFEEFKGQLNNVQNVKQCFDKYYDIARKLEVICVYAMMKKDEDGSLGESMALYSSAENAEIKFSTQTVFINTELSSLPTEKLEELASAEELLPYKKDILKIIEFKPHMLGDEAEGLLALGGKVFGGFSKIFSMIDNVDLPIPTITVDGEKVKITSATYSVLLQNKDVLVRKKAFKAYYKAYKSLLNTITATYVSNIEKNVFISKARKFSSCLDRALFNEEVDKSVYFNLISATNDALPLVHRYVKLRRDILCDKIHMYDLYVPLVKDAELKLDFNEAFNLVLEGLKPLGEDYINILKRAKAEKWIDVYENQGKRSGAYEVCSYDLKHPYVLLNHTKTTHSVFTIAHELGHAIHSYKSNQVQPITTADYKIFVAEVASTVNEILLIKHLIKNAKSDNEKKYYLSYFLDTVRTTLFRQTMFAEFEQIAHERAEKGEPVTKEVLNEIYLKLNKKYYGKHVVSDKEISFEWARIPHFYTAFYVYKYATGIISAMAIADRILTEGQKAVDDYFKFLSSGSSDKPVELLKIAGVNLNDKKSFECAFKLFEDALTQFENLN